MAACLLNLPAPNVNSGSPTKVIIRKEKITGLTKDTKLKYGEWDM